MYIYYTQGHLLWFFFTFLRRLFRSAAAFNVLDIWMLRGIESSSLLYSILWLPPYYVVGWPKQFVFSWRCHLPCSPAGRWSINYGLEGCCKQQGSSDCLSLSRSAGIASGRKHGTRQEQVKMAGKRLKIKWNKRYEHTFASAWPGTI